MFLAVMIFLSSAWAQNFEMGRYVCPKGATVTGVTDGRVNCDWILCKPGSALNAEGDCVDHYNCPSGQVYIPAEEACKSLQSCADLGRVVYNGLCLRPDSVSLAACGKEGMKYFADSGKCYPAGNKDVQKAIKDPILDCNKGAAGALTELMIAKYERSYDGSITMDMIKQKIKNCKLSTAEVTKLDLAVSKNMEELKQAGKKNVLKQLEIKKKLGDTNANDEIREMHDLGVKNARSDWDKQIPGILKQQKDNCAAVDMRDKMGAVRDQDGSGLCYAYVAANMVSYKLGQRVSALDISYLYQQDPKKDYKYENGGSIEDALKTSASKGGFCLEEKFSDSDVGDTRTLITRLTDLTDKKWNREFAADQTVPFTAKGHYCPDNSSLPSLFPQQKKQDLMQSMNYVMRDQAGQMINKACAPRLKAPQSFKVEGIDMTGSDKTEQFDKIDQLLSEKNPIGISVKKFRPWRMATEQSANHGLTLAGRRWNADKNQCEYIIRNSWGTFCSGGYPAEFSCDKGDLFVTKKDLNKYIFDATYIK